MIFDINKSNIVLNSDRKESNIKIVLGRWVRVEDSDGENDDTEFIQKLLKETETKKKGPQANNKINIESGNGA